MENFLPTTVQLSHVLEQQVLKKCVYNFMWPVHRGEIEKIKIQEHKMILTGDHSGRMRRQGKPPDQLEVSEWMLPGGPGGEVTEGGLVMSCQLLSSRR